MIDVLAPLGLLALVGLVVVIALTARKQKREQAGVFADLAASKGWRLLDRDDGTARRLSDGFDRFARFHSPSIGERLPAPVVLGSVEEGRVCLFLHATRDHPGDARQWTVCLVEAAKHLGPDLEIRPRSVRRVKRVGVAPVVPFDDPRFEESFEVRCADAAAARACLDSSTRELLIAAAGNVAHAVALQIRDRRLAVYLAARNDVAESPDELRELVDHASSVVRGLLR